MTSLEKIDSYVWLNGVFVHNSEAKIHIASHSLHYAGAVFEGIRAYQGKAFKLREHYTRFLKSAELIGYKVPYEVDVLCSATEEILHKQKFINAYIRPVAWRGGEKIQVKGDGCKIHTAIIVFDPFTGEVKAREGIKLEIAKWRKIPANAVPFASKASGLYMMATLIQNQAVERGFDDALVLDQDGCITEATTSNFFFVKNGTLLTPRADNFLNGITRQTVINEIAKALHIKVMEGKFIPEDLDGATSAFLTGTTAGISFIGSIYDNDNSKSYDFAPGDAVFGSVSAEYARLVGAA